MADGKSKANAHSIINISFDTETRGVVLSIDGIVTPFTDVNFHKFVFDDGEQHVGFSYTIETTNENGLKERREFFLPAKAQVGVDVDERGFASKILHDDDKAKADVIDFLSKKSNKV